HGFSDVIGILLMSAALLMLFALFSFDRHDLSANTVPPNESTHNWIGPFGARLGNGLFFLFGAGAFLLPLVLLAFGAGYIFKPLSYLRHRWLWAAALFFSCLGLLGFYSSWLETLKQNINAPNA